MDLVNQTKCAQVVLWDLNLGFSRVKEYREIRVQEDNIPFPIPCRGHVCYNSC